MRLRVATQRVDASPTTPKAKRQAGTGEAPARLDTSANNASRTYQTAVEVRKHRYDQRRKMRGGLTTLSRVSHCGHTPTGGAVSLTRSTAGIANWSGTQSCGSVWACPCCSGLVMSGRQKELKRAASKWGETGRLGLLTLTMRHKRSDRLEDLWDALSAAWRAVSSGSGWVRDKADFGIGGFVRAVEVTHGENGFHLHIHALLFLERGLDDDESRFLFARVFSRWETALVKAGLEAPLSKAQDFQIVQDADMAMAEYLAKAVSTPWGVSEEMTRSDIKKGRGGHRTPWEILADALEGDIHSVLLWRDYEQASKGRRALTWSRGLRDLLCLEDELTDEQLAAQDPLEESPETEVVAILDLPAWKKLQTMFPGGDVELLRLAEIDGKYARKWLSERLIDYRRLSRDEPPKFEPIETA